jgi:Zn-dependent M28 family amino/carboxypeptidase
VVGGRAAGKKLADDYTDHRYHQPSDEWKADWDLSGPLLDVKALYATGVDLANSDVWPGWYPGSEFKAARDKEMAGKKQN